MLVPTPNRRLGKLAPRHDPRTPKLASYRRKALAPPPSSADWTKGIAAWPMMANDRYGDCAWAAQGHLIQLWTGNVGRGFVPTDAEILAAYASTGFDPVTGANDDGTVLLDALSYWHTTGIGGHKLAAYATLNVADLDEHRHAINLLGGSYIGLDLPAGAQGQAVWDVPPGGPVGYGTPGSWGGHCVPLVAYDQAGFTCVTWGGLLKMTPAFLATYCDEAYACLAADWFDAKAISASHLDLLTLMRDMEQLGPTDPPLTVPLG